MTAAPEHPSSGVQASCTVCGEPLPRALDGACPVCLLRVEVPRAGRSVIGTYERLQKLAEGGTATVFLARHTAHEELVALKVAKPEMAASAEARAAFGHG